MGLALEILALLAVAQIHIVLHLIPRGAFCTPIWYIVKVSSSRASCGIDESNNMRMRKGCIHRSPNHSDSIFLHLNFLCALSTARFWNWLPWISKTRFFLAEGLSGLSSSVISVSFSASVRAGTGTQNRTTVCSLGMAIGVIQQVNFSPRKETDR